MKNPFGIGMLVAMPLLMAGLPVMAAEEKPNILLIVADDHGYGD